MSRPNKVRQVFAEDNLAARIAVERDARAWTNEELARRMTEAGCPLTTSAIFKLEKGRPRRRIVVDELVTFSAVFGIPLEELLLPPELWGASQLAPLVEEWRLLTARQMETSRAFTAREQELRAQIAGLAADVPGARDVIEATLKGAMGAESTWPERLADILTEDR